MLSAIIFTVFVTFIVTTCIVYAFPRAFNLVSWEDYNYVMKLWRVVRDEGDIARSRATEYEAMLCKSQNLTQQCLEKLHKAAADNRSLRVRTWGLQASDQIMEAALQELSRLGNGDHPGNSVGNSIAQRALKTCGRI